MSAAWECTGGCDGILTYPCDYCEEMALAELNATPGDAEAEAEAREGTGL